MLISRRPPLKSMARGIGANYLCGLTTCGFDPYLLLAKFSATLKDADTRMGPGQAKGGGVAKNFSHRQGVFRPSRRQAVASFNPMFSPTSQRLNHPPARSPPASSQGPTPALDDLKLWGKLWGIGVRQVKSAFRKFNTFGTCSHLPHAAGVSTPPTSTIVKGLQ